MHCIACDALLSDYESSLKDSHGKYVDMCIDCLKTIPEVEVSGNDSLNHYIEDFYPENDYDLEDN
jgi:hypothetical protein